MNLCNTLRDILRYFVYSFINDNLFCINIFYKAKKTYKYFYCVINITVIFLT